MHKKADLQANKQKTRFSRATQFECGIIVYFDCYTEVLEVLLLVTVRLAPNRYQRCCWRLDSTGSNSSRAVLIPNFLWRWLLESNWNLRCRFRLDITSNQGACDVLARQLPVLRLNRHLSCRYQLKLTSR